jgi:FG-GAP repeat
MASADGVTALGASLIGTVTPAEVSAHAIGLMARIPLSPWRLDPRVVLGESTSAALPPMAVSPLGQFSSTYCSPFSVPAGSWSQQAELTAADGAAGDGFGYSVAISGSTAVAGAPFKDSSRGAAYVFVNV